MARVRVFNKGHSTPKLHPTEVVCTYHVGLADNGKKLFQLDTSASDERQLQGKISQTLQLDEKASRDLWEILGKEFNFK